MKTKKLIKLICRKTKLRLKIIQQTKKNHIFRQSTFFVLAVTLTRKIIAYGPQKIPTSLQESTMHHNETLFGKNCCLVAASGLFVTVNGERQSAMLTDCFLTTCDILRSIFQNRINNTSGDLETIKDKYYANNLKSHIYAGIAKIQPETYKNVLK